MKAKALTYLVLLFALTFAVSCKNVILSNKRGTLSPPLASFNSLDISVPLKAHIQVVNNISPSIKIEGNEEILKHIKTSISGTVLKVYSENWDNWGTFLNNDSIVATIMVPALTDLILSGACYTSIGGNVTGVGFKMDLSGATTVVVDSLNVTDLSINLSGAGNLFFKSGKVQRANYDVSGAGKIKAFPLQTEETKMGLSGASHAEITAISKLSIEASGASDLRYKGHPAITQDVSGASNLVDAN